MSTSSVSKITFVHVFAVTCWTSDAEISVINNGTFVATDDTVVKTVPVSSGKLNVLSVFVLGAVIVTVPVLVKSGGGVVNQQSSSTTVASTGGGSGNDPYEVLDFQG